MIGIQNSFFSSSCGWYDLKEQKYILTLMEIDCLVENSVSCRYKCLFFFMRWIWYTDPVDVILAALNKMDRQIHPRMNGLGLSLHIECRFKVVREINPTVGFGRSRSTGHCWFHSGLYLGPRRGHRGWGNYRWRGLTIVGIPSVDDGCWGWLVDGWFRSA